MSCRNVQILLDDARPGRERVRRFVNPVAVVQAMEPGTVDAALAAMEAARGSGRYAAGYFSYELGYVLEPKLTRLLPTTRDVPLLWFGIFDRCEDFGGLAARKMIEEQVRSRAYAGPLAHEWQRAAYRERFARVHDLIAAGDIYQANLSMRSRFATVGDPMALYLALRERSGAAHCAFIDDGVRHILSLSPELFFSIAPDGEIVTKPMKGTAPRSDDPAKDEALRAALSASAKDRAENLMIVDLLRNDLGRIAQTGSVSVDELFKVETYPTLHTMVSTVRATLHPQTEVPQVVKALFPCGSVTGTPKIRAMEVIGALEKSPRGVYCGAIGYFAPDGSADFNVAIRTLTLAQGRGELGIGGAVVHDSTADGEYDECLLKARYYDVSRRPLELIETLRYAVRSGVTRHDLHIDRMKTSAAAFGIPFDSAQAQRVLDQAVHGSAGDMRVRLTLNEAGTFACTATPLVQTPSLWTYAISPLGMCGSDELLRHKTNWREVYEAEMARAARDQGCDEVIFVNDRGALTEGSRSNIFVQIEGRMLTPALDAGVLNGCLRRELIESGECEEANLVLGDFEKADGVFLGNSLRGLVAAAPVRQISACAE